MKHNYFTLFFLLLLTSFHSLFATDYYIDPTNGSDGNNGLSSTNAFRSLYQIDNINLQPGDTVYFMDGTYERSGQTLLTINESGTADNYITFTNFEDSTPILEFDSWTGIDIIGGSSYIEINGLHIKGAREKVNHEDALAQGAGCEADFTGGAEGFYNGTGILAVGPNLTWSNSATSTVPHHITVTNCKIYDCTSSGMAFQQADYVTVTNNEVYNNCWYTIYGTSGINLYQFINTDGTTGFHNEISNNLMYGNQLLVPQVPYCSYLDGNGLIIDDFRHTQTGNYKDSENGYDAYDAKSLIANNVSVENGGSGLHFYLSENCYILNNTIANNAFQNDGDNGNAELRIGGCFDFVVKNNIIKSENSVHTNSNNVNLEYTNNYQYGPSIQSALVDCEGCISDNEIEFLNTDIESATPYITDFTDVYTDAGIALTEIDDDFLGNTRPYGDSYDMGAYELRDCTLQTWYADTDNDEYGDESISISACDQPEGYVANSTDECPNDSNKMVPGECGCGEVEGTCDEVEEIEDICDSPEYDSETTYSEAGTTVIYNGVAYENKWHTQGQLPTGGDPWVSVGFCDAEASDCSAIASWSSSTIYAQAGNQVVYNETIYENKWYISGDVPDTSEAWSLIGLCDTTTLIANSTSFKSIDSDQTSINLVKIYSLSGALVLEYTTDNKPNELYLTYGIYISHAINTNTGSITIEKIVVD